MIALLAPAAIGGHANDSCALLGQNNKEQVAVAENASPSGSRTGVSATIRVVDPNPAVDTVIVRSLYIVKNSAATDFIEFGWKWLVDPAASTHQNDTTDVNPQPFAVRVSGMTTFLSEGDHTGIWATMEPPSNHTFRIEANIDGSHPNTFYFYRDGQGPGSLYHGGMTAGFVVAGSEANALCDSLFTHHWSLKRETGAGWNDWSNTVKVTSVFADRSKWWYFDRLSTKEYRLDHCTSQNCADVD